MVIPIGLNSTAEKQLWLLKNVGRTMKRNREMKFKESLPECPYPNYNYDIETGYVKVERKRDCSLGKGEWCALCPHYERYRNTAMKYSKHAYKMKKLKMLDSYNKTGLAPWLRRKPRLNPYERW